MVPTICFTSDTLKTFLDDMGLSLTKPQRRHLEEVSEGLLMTEGRKTLCRLTRQLVEERDVYAVADFFRESPWTVEDLRAPLLGDLMVDVRACVGALPASRRVVVIGLDHSLNHKPRSSRHFEPVDWHGDCTEHTAGVGPRGQRYAHGVPVVT